MLGLNPTTTETSRWVADLALREAEVVGDELPQTVFAVGDKVLRHGERAVWRVEHCDIRIGGVAVYIERDGRTCVAPASSLTLAPPFAAGDRVVTTTCNNWFLPAGRVASCVPHARGGWTVWMTDGSAIPSRDLIALPADWEDAPAQPSGGIQYGLSEAARQAKISNDRADRAYRQATAEWHCIMVMWCGKHLKRVNPGEALGWIDYHGQRLLDMAAQS